MPKSPWNNGALASDGTPTDPSFADAFHHLGAAVGDNLRAIAGSEVNDLISQGKSALVNTLGAAMGLSPDAVALGKSLLGPDPASDSHSGISGYVGGAIDPWRDPLKESATELAGYAKQSALLATGCNCDPFAGSLGDPVLAKAVGTVVSYGIDRTKETITNTLDQQYKQLTGDDPVSNSALRFGPVLSGIGNPLNAIKQLKQWMSGNVDQLSQYFQRQEIELFGLSSGQ